jgi:hypothetical protein
MTRHGSADRKPAGFWKSTEVQSILENYVHSQIGLDDTGEALRKLLREGFKISDESLKEDVKWYARETRKRLGMLKDRSPRPAPTPPRDKQTDVQPLPVLDVARLDDLRRQLLRVLDRVDPDQDRQDEGVAARIGRLSKAGVIPRELAACMHTITEARNVGVYQGKTPSPALARAVEAAWTVIKEWATSDRRAWPSV